MASSLKVLLALAILVTPHTRAATSNVSETTPELMFMEGESMPTNLKSTPPVAPSNSATTSSTEEELPPPATEVADMMQSKEPLEVVDMNIDPYRNTTETAATSREDIVGTLASDDVTSSSATWSNSSTSSATWNTSIGEAAASQPAVVVAVQHGDHSDHGHLDNGKTAPFSQPTEAAGIMAGVLISLAVSGYVGLMLWRKFLERRYNNREMLVNEDADEDLHHFEL